MDPVLPATASAFSEYAIDLEHTAVIRTLLVSAAARRLEPPVWAAVESQLAVWARRYPAEVLQNMGRQLINGLDHDGDEPDDGLDRQVNELRLTRASDGRGGWLTARLDSVTFDALVQVIEALITRRDDSGKTLAERQAEALGELCERVLRFDDEPPETGGQAPQVAVTIDYEELLRGVRGATLSATGCEVGPKEVRRIACDAQVIPVVLGGDSQPLDVGRARRFASRSQRVALAVRDGGCAHPSCTTAPKWCTPHHIRFWSFDSTADLDNLVLLCRTHHRMVHHADWEVRIRNGLPEFIPSRWIDPEQKPRRRPRPQLVE